MYDWRSESSEGLALGERPDDGYFSDACGLRAVSSTNRPPRRCSSIRQRNEKHPGFKIPSNRPPAIQINAQNAEVNSALGRRLASRARTPRSATERKRASSPRRSACALQSACARRRAADVCLHPYSPLEPFRAIRRWNEGAAARGCAPFHRELRPHGARGGRIASLQYSPDQEDPYSNSKGDDKSRKKRMMLAEMTASRASLSAITRHA
jgi:hypothetical protein